MSKGTTHPYYMFPGGELISKQTVDDALQLINKMAQGFELIQLTDAELFSKGKKIDAIRRFYEKYEVSLVEAQAAINFLRGEDP